MPAPLKDEKQKDFINRCMADKSLTEKYSQNEQRFTVCNNRWEKTHLKESSSAFEIDMSGGLPKVKLAKADLENDDTPATAAELMLTNMLQMQQQYRIFHWQTKSYSEHKAFGAIYEALDGKIDLFIETFMGKYGRAVTSPELEIEMLNYQNGLACVAATDSYIGFLTYVLPSLLQLEDTNLLNIRDEILTELNQLKYLLTLT